MRLPIARGGWAFIAPPLALTVLAAAALPIWVAAAFFILTVFLVQFFRDPERTSAQGPDAILSPADGTILSIGAAGPDEAPPDLPKKIVIFMSVVNCHVNRSPIAGTVASYSYSPGKKLAAFSPKASSENEQNRIEVTGESQRVVFKQIAGALARRIVFRKKPGDRLDRGERIGMIRFGSRVDLFLSRDARVEVREGDRVKAGLSVIARAAAPR
ncbi:MAG: phosphatidylserine decarboxylase [Thermoanaerobaculia bacterium]